MTIAHWTAEKLMKHHRSVLAHKKYHLLECQKNSLDLLVGVTEKLPRKLTTGMLANSLVSCLLGCQ